MLRFFAGHVGLAVVLATIWAIGVVGGYFAWVIWGGWGRDGDLALAQAIFPLAGAGFGIVVVMAAVLAFRPPQPKLDFYVVSSGLTGPTLTVQNTGNMPAAGVTIELTGANLDFQVLSAHWKFEQQWKAPDLQPTTPGTYTWLIARERSLQGQAQESVISVVGPREATHVRVSGENAAAVGRVVKPGEWQAEILVLPFPWRQRLRFWVDEQRIRLRKARARLRRR